jgi:hypothetical protein
MLNKLNNEIKPIFFDYKLESQKKGAIELLEKFPELIVLDEIKGQLEELIKLRNPKKKFTVEELNNTIAEHVGDIPLKNYGIWVYYPWLNNLIHLLNESEFVEVRSNRNQNKITFKEQQILRTKKVGIIGLSVGQSVAITLALESVVGELNIADFDTLELSNLNRIRTGVQNLGVQKTVAVAREIAEIDPFLKVNCFHEGITEENIDDFLLKDRKIDLLIDECDGLDIKVLCRLKAKEYRIPVIMDTSERGTLDVERFDLHPERSIFHGLIDHLDISKIKEAKTNEEKVPYILALIGWETISDKMKASMVEVEQSISTWPQLASSVTMGGGMTCDVARRILLDQYHDSGRYIVDIEELIANKKEHDSEIADSKINVNEEVPKIEVVETLDSPPLTKAVMLDLAKKAIRISNNSNEIVISEELVQKLVSKAILAPTGGNSQPWKWLFFDNQLFLFHDSKMSTQFLDYESYGAYVGLGAAVENLTLETHRNKLDVQVITFPIKNCKQLVASIGFQSLNSYYNYDYLVNYLEQRCTDRNIYPSEPITPEMLEGLKTMCKSISGTSLQFIVDKDDLKNYGKILGRCDKLLLTTKETHAEFMNEIRWNEEEVKTTKTGVDIKTIDLTATEIAGFKMIHNWSVVKYLNKWGGGSAFEKLSKKCAESAYAIGMITIPNLTQKSFFEGGIAMERVWLEATKQNLKIHPLCALNYMFIRLIQGEKEGMDDKMITELKELRKKHEKLFDNNDEIGVFFFRIFKGNKQVKRAIRKDIKDVLIYA